MDFLGSVVNNSATATNPAEKQLRPVLCDENIQVLSTFELNQFASLTYNDVTCDGIFEFIGAICIRPLDYTALTIQKALIVVKHIVVYGSEKTVNHAYGLQGRIQPLLEFNTVLMTQKQGGTMSFFQTLQGGAVDKGGPVREAAGKLLHLLGNIPELRRLRLASASEDSLVPVGNNAQVAFVTDEARLQILKRKMAEENRVRVQSNLKKSEGGFGAGYASKDGRSVVGAAHGIDEMIKMAKIHQKKHLNHFSDDGLPREKTQEEIILEELKTEADAEKAKRAEAARAAAAANAPSADLLGSFGAPTPTPPLGATSTPEVGDLLDFGGSTGGGGPSTSVSTGDLLGGDLPATHPSSQSAAASADPFGLTSAYGSTTTASASASDVATRQYAAPLSNHPAASSSLLDFSVQNDLFAPVSETANRSVANDVTGLMSMTVNSMNANANTNTNAMTGSANDPMMAMMQPAMHPASNNNNNNGGMTNDLSSGLTSLSLSYPPPMHSAQPPAPSMVPPPIAASNGDRFSALDALAATATPPADAAARDAEARILGLGGAGPGPVSMPSSGINTAFAGTAAPMGGGPSVYPAAPPPATMPPMTMMTGGATGTTIPDPMVLPGSGRIATAYGDGATNDGVGGEDDNPWVMGGTTGMGLEPVGPVPSQLPPPPPPDHY